MRSFAAIAALAALPAVSANMWGKPLRFRADGTFKIVEASDAPRTRSDCVLSVVIVC
jgi:hypothetical protein